MDTLKIGIIGAGRIASVLADTMVRMPDVELVGIAGLYCNASFRTLQSCKAMSGKRQACSL